VVTHHGTSSGATNTASAVLPRNRTSGGVQRSTPGGKVVVVPLPSHGPFGLRRMPGCRAGAYAESSSSIPLLFVLSPGTDPTAALLSFAESRNMAGPGKFMVGGGRGGCEPRSTVWPGNFMVSVGLQSM